MPEPLDTSRPVFLVVYQTEKRLMTETVQGDDARAQAKARASQLAARTGLPVMVFGPQSNVYQRPPKVEAVEVQLTF